MEFIADIFEHLISKGPVFYALRIVIGAGIGFVIGLTGVGGGVLVMPSLVLVLGYKPSEAVGTASLYAFITKAYAVFEHHRLKNISYKISIIFLSGAIPGGIIAAIIVLAFSNGSNAAQVLAFEQDLKMFIAWVMVLATSLLVFNIIKKLIEGRKNGSNASQVSEKTDIQTEKETISPVKLFFGLLGSVLIGALIGSTATGSGVMVIPFFLIFFGLTTTKAVGSSIFGTVILNLVTAITYMTGGTIQLLTALIMGAGSFVGVFFGSRVSVKIPEKLLQVIVIFVITISTVSMFLKVD